MRPSRIFKSEEGYSYKKPVGIVAHKVDFTAENLRGRTAS